uniref:Uncharacterized protein n=1 Tax=Chlamydomonas leiostraca TaxID=1034604 RepID=A0A7S0WNQ8_9CHLO|mmetsp:Transcript_20911/g.53169  ORF Transcript_20911/g.53169 Transcript_20911/m.53169 type:complete len:124 (+) Transcript_20911:3-374(+)
MDVVKRFMRWGCLPGAERSIVLMGAAQRGHQAICRLLVAGGADPNILKPFLLTAVQTMDVPLYNNYMKSGVLPEVLLREAQEALHQQYETVHGMIGTFEELQLQQELRAMRVVSTVFYKGSLL